MNLETTSADEASVTLRKCLASRDVTAATEKPTEEKLRNAVNDS